jgi:hypothetical protein
VLDLASAKVPHIRPVVVALLVVTATVTVTVPLLAPAEQGGTAAQGQH